MLKLYYGNICSLQDEQVLECVFKSVNEQRRKKVLRCKQEKDKYRSLLAGYLLRIALEDAEMDYDNISVSILGNGKPVILESPHIQFSLSHAGDYAVCVISDRPVGVDIETKTRFCCHKKQEEQLAAIVRKIATKQEQELFCATKEEEKIEYFLQLWTRKESYSKADGRGLAIGLHQVDTNTEAFYTKWLDEDVMLSIYVENSCFSDLQIKKIKDF